MKILIVEDELIAAEYLKRILESNGYSVIDVVDSGNEAIRVAKTEQPDIILMDIYLQGHMSGCEAALHISKTFTGHIVFLTAYAEEEMVDYAVAAHASGYLMKPYNEAEILATLRLLAPQQKHPVASPAPFEPSTVTLANGYSFVPAERKLLHHGKEVYLGSKGIKLIEVLCEYSKISVPNETIMRHIWGEEKSGQTLRSLVYRTRQVIGEEMIINYNGTGYIIATP